jgi:hypothetical protein
MSLDLVVARYNENLNWLRRVPEAFRVTIYDKSGEAESGTIALPNVGREAHTYFWHVVQHYEQLADVTIFCQGRPFDHAYDFHQTLRDLAESPVINGFLPLGHIVDTDDAQGRRLFTRWSKNEDGHELDMRGFHQALFQSCGPEEYTFRLGAQFGVTRQLIQKRPRDFYQRALQVSIEFPDAAHCFERSWPLVFGIENPDSIWLEGRKTAYLKPIRRLAND